MGRAPSAYSPRIATTRGGGAVGQGADGSRLDAKLPGELMAFLASIKYIGSFEEPVYLELVKHTQTQTVRAHGRRSQFGGQRR